jgi:Tfp pilus assembly protein PilE
VPSKKGNSGGSAKTPQVGEKPARDVYDWLIFGVQVAGVLAVVATIAVSLYLARSSSRDTAKAIATMSNIAGTLENQQAAIINQSEATADLAMETNTVAAATQKQANTSENTASTASKQLTQSRELFATQQKPIIDYDASSASSTGFGFDDSVGMYGWNFAFKNVGVSSAHKLVSKEALSLDGVHFQIRIVSGALVTPPGAGGYDTASYRPTPEERRRGAPLPTLRVKFEYSDDLGRRLTNEVCRQMRFGQPHDC